MGISRNGSDHKVLVLEPPSPGDRLRRALLPFRTDPNEHHAARERRQAENRRQRHRVLFLHIGVNFQRAKVDDALLLVRGKMEAAIGESDNADDDQEDANNGGWFHSSRVRSS